MQKSCKMQFKSVVKREIYCSRSYKCKAQHQLWILKLFLFFFYFYNTIYYNYNSDDEIFSNFVRLFDQ